MKKITRLFEVEKVTDWTYGIDISELREDLDRLEKLGATYIDIEPEESYGCAYVDIIAYAKREETDEEYIQRLENEQKRMDDLKQRELEQLRMLQEKYQKP